MHFHMEWMNDGITHTLGFEDPDMRIGDALLINSYAYDTHGRTCESSRYRKRPITVNRNIGQRICLRVGRRSDYCR